MDIDTTPPRDLISRPEAGRMLGITYRGVDGLVARGELRAWRIGKRVKLSHAEVVEYLLRAQGWIPAGRERNTP